jgi:hypothetical protein
MVVRLVNSMLKQQHYLTIGYQKSPLLLAWACRNLLELAGRGESVAEHGL